MGNQHGQKRRPAVRRDTTSGQTQSQKGKALAPPPFRPTAEQQFEHANLLSDFFGPGFAPLATQTIEKIAGEDGDITSTTLEADISTLSGTDLRCGIDFTVYNLKDGYRLVLRPKLGAAMQQDGGPFSGALLPSYGIDVQAETIPRALELGLLVLEAELRGYTHGPMSYLSSIPLGAAGAPLDYGIKHIHERNTGEFENPYWNTAADFAFGENNMDKLMAGLQPGEHANSMDQIDVEGGASNRKGSQSDQETAVSSTLSVGHSRDRTITYDEQSGRGQMENMDMFLLNFNLGVGKGKGDFKLRAPVNNKEKGVLLKMAFSYQADAGVFEPILGTLEAGLKHILTTLSHYQKLKSSDQNTPMESLQSIEELNATYKGLFSKMATNMAFAEGVNRHLKTTDGLQQEVDKTYELVLTWDLADRTLRVALYAIYTGKVVEAKGQNVRFNRKNLVFEG
ncbi:MAG: hypothetical protein KDC44_17695 [Phaeodactylibacter sp.]|nr:hypothetical protein [Phaeodactylibacter sp.]